MLGFISILTIGKIIQFELFVLTCLMACNETKQMQCTGMNIFISMPKEFKA